MTKNQPQRLELKREGERKGRPRFRWWYLAIVLPLVLFGGFWVWLNQLALRDMFEAAFYSPTPLPPPPQASTPGVLYQTDFSDPAVATDWDLFNDTMISSAFGDGRLVVGVNALENTSGFSAMHFMYDDFVLDVDSTNLSGPDNSGIVVVFRMQDRNNYNRFDIATDGTYAVSMARNGQYILVSDLHESPAIQRGANATNHIRVFAQGDTFRFEVNGTVLQLCINPDPSVQPIWTIDQSGQITCDGGEIADSWQNSDFLSGKVGLGAQGYIAFDINTGELSPAVASIAFDNLEIRTPEAVAGP